MSKTGDAIAQAFNLDQVSHIAPHYNIAPTQIVSAVLCTLGSDQRQHKQLHWGLIPSWAKDMSIGAKLINARAETVAEKPSFRSAFKRRRCLVVGDGFYEWQRQDGKKQPFYFRLQDGKLFGFAGLWEEWTSAQGETIASCTILTTDANELMAPIHNRMPVIVAPQDYDLWLDPQVQTPELLQHILHPYASGAMTAYPVSTLVNKPSNDTPECINSL